MRILTILLLLISSNILLAQNNENFVVLNTYDTISIMDVANNYRYVKVINKPDTIFFKTNGFIFEPANLDKPPSFTGGTSALIAWLNENFHYPAEARKNNIHGKVRVRFVVDENGMISDVNVVKKVDELLDNEAIRLIKAMPKWLAGVQAGQKVRSYYTLPITFNLGD
jgi:TonB family protein